MTQITPIETARTVLGQYPQEIIGTLNIGYTSLEWLDSVLHAIEVLNERGGGSIHIKYLAELGQYVTSDVGSLLDCEREKFLADAKAGEVL